MPKRTTAVKTSKRTSERGHLTRSRAAKRSASTGDFVVEKKGSNVYVNGYKILMPEGRGSVSRKKMQDAARTVAAGRK